MKKFKAINQYDSTLFDCLRGASALFVLIGHIYQFIIAPSYQLDTENNLLSFMFSQLAVLSVMVFFVLSGFMITASMYRNASELNFKQLDINTFFKDRLIRLYPPLIFALLLTFLLFFIAALFQPSALESISNGQELYLVRPKLQLDTSNLVASLFFLQNFFDELSTPSMNSPLWSLSHEFWFYVLAIVIAQSFFNRRFIFPLFILLAVAFISDEKVMFLAGFCIWLSGSMLALLYFNGMLQDAKIKLILIVAFVVLMGVYSAFVIMRESHLFLYGGKFVFGIMFTCALALIITLSKHHTEKFVKNSVVRFFKNSAKYSYTLYLIHAPILLFCLAIFHELILFKPLYYLGLSATLGLIIIIFSKHLANYLENKPYILRQMKRLSVPALINKRT